MRYSVKHIFFPVLLMLTAGCVKQSPQDSLPAQNGEKDVVLMIKGGVESYHVPTKAPEEFTPSSSNLLYLYLFNNNGSYSITGRGSYDEDRSTWLFTYDGGVSEGLTSGDVYGYLFEKEWHRYGSGTDEYIELGPRVPVYEAPGGKFEFVRDTLFIDAQFAPITSRIGFTQVLADGESREVYWVSGLRYYSRFNPNTFLFDDSGDSFYGASADNKTYFYGNALFPTAPVLLYDAHGYYFVKHLPATALQTGESGYVYLPQDSKTYEGWKKYRRGSYDWWIDGTRNLCFRFVACGSFYMGGTDAQPIHEVTLTDSFFMMETEVDQSLWYQIMGGPEEYRYQTIPVTGKSWEEIQEFIAKMSAYYKCTFRLPTEAEWEYAARGGMYETANYLYYTYSGSDDIDAVAWFKDNSEDRIHNIWEKNCNDLALDDMSGNVAELCSDWYADYKADDVVDPAGPETGTVHVVRGGSAFSTADWCTNTHRGKESDYAPEEIGFRLVMIPPSFPD